MNSRFATWRRLGRPEIWGRPLLTLAALVFAILTLLFDAVLLNSWTPAWLIIYFVTLAEVVLLAYLVKRFILIHLNMKRFGTFINLAVAAALGSVKNLSVGFLATNLGVELDPLWSFRILGGAGLGIGVFVFCGLAVGARVEHTAIMDELSHVQANLLELRSNSKTRLAEAKAYLATSTRDALFPRLEKLQNLIFKRGETADAITHLKEFIRDDVRPLSESLSSRAASLVQQPAPAHLTRKKFTIFQPRVKLSDLLRPNATFFALSTISWLFAYMIVSAPECNDVYIASFFSWGILWFAKLLIPKHAKVAGPTAIAIICSIAIIAAVPAVLAGIAISPLEEKGGLFFSIFIFAVITASYFAFAAGLDLDRAEVRQQLQRENEELAHDVALFEQQLWLERRAWQFVVHGTVQGALTAALTRLQGSPELDAKTLKLIDQDLARASAAMVAPPERDVNLSESLAQMKSAWRGICQIQASISPEAKSALSDNRDARLCVNEIVKECVSNGIRHGNAKDILIDISTRDDCGLAIRVTNDGIPVKSKSQKGVGSRLIDELTSEWSIASDIATGLTVFEANLPLTRDPASNQH